MKYFSKNNFTDDVKIFHAVLIMVILPIKQFFYIFRSIVCQKILKNREKLLLAMTVNDSLAKQIHFE